VAPAGMTAPAWGKGYLARIFIKKVEVKRQKYAVRSGAEYEQRLGGAGGEGHRGDKADLAGAELGAAELEAGADGIRVLERDRLGVRAAQDQVGAGRAVGELLAEQAPVVDPDGRIDLSVGRTVRPSRVFAPAAGSIWRRW